MVAVTPVADAVLRVVCPVTVTLEMVVVAKVEVPVTAREPVVDAFPFPSTLKLKFSCQFESFQ